MPGTIEGYAVIGDCRSAALISERGSIDWLCLPRFDSASLFGALLGDAEQGQWTLRPSDDSATATRAYLPDTFTLVTRWRTDEGEVEVTELMPRIDGRSDVIRRLRGIRGTVTMSQALRIRFDYAASLPWVRQVGTADAPELLAVAGPDALVVRGTLLTPHGNSHVAEMTITEGQTLDLQLTWFPAHLAAPSPLVVDDAIDETASWWQSWMRGFAPPGVYEEAVRRSLLVLRLLTHQDTGGVGAAATTSLPEAAGGVRNWDYRYVWLRDAALTIEALMHHGFVDEVEGWRRWLLRAVAGDPADVQIMYGIAGERRLPEWEVPTLPGYHGASPVRVGNAASEQFQADVFGEVMIALDAARHVGVGDDEFSWSLQVALLGEVERSLDRPDSGIWEIRGQERRFTHSRAMLWAALDRGVCGVEHDGRRGPVEHWRTLRERLAVEIETIGFDSELGSYVQFAGSREVDAALLQLPQIGYLAHDDPRMLGTVARIEQTLLRDGLLRRYRTEADVDGLTGDENAFLACSFWLVEHYAHVGRLDEADALMERLLGFRSELGLLSEEFDARHGRQAGNTPQALSHLALVRAADAIAHARGVVAHAARASVARSSRRGHSTVGVQPVRRAAPST